MPECTYYAASRLGELHDWFSGALAFVLLLVIGLGALLAGWQVTRRDRSPSRAASMLVVSVLAGCAATSLGTLLVSTSARCGKDDRSAGRWTMNSESVQRSGFPAYFVVTSKAIESPPETDRRVPLALANIVFLSGLSYSAAAWSMAKARSGRRFRSPNAQAS
jgi:drug/metabolite transporter (DMT)-like permease